MVERVKHERILLERPARVYIEDDDELLFETYCTSRDLSISGIFLNTSALLRIGTAVQVDLEVRSNEILALNGEVIRRIEFGDREHPPGYAVQFGVLSPRSHETLLRYFVTDRIVQFTKIFQKHFPHLDRTVTEQDLALVVNLWEDQRHSLIEESRVAPVSKPAPSMFAPPAARPLAQPSRPVAPARPPPAPRIEPQKPTPARAKKGAGSR